MKRQNWKMLITVICLLAAGICYGYSRHAEKEGSRQVLLLQETGTAEALAGLSESVAAAPEAEAASEPKAASETGTAPEAEVEAELKGAETSQPTEQMSCYVHICGEVQKPGVYEVAYGSRIYQVVERAGGFTEDAADGYLNMAQVIWDGMKIVIPSLKDLEQDEIYGQPGGLNGQPDGLNGQSDGLSGQPGGLNGQPGESFGSPAAVAETKINLNTATKEELMTLSGIGEARAEAILKYRQEYGPFHAIEDIMEVSGIKDGAFQKIKDDITV